MWMGSAKKGGRPSSPGRLPGQRNQKGTIKMTKIISRLYDNYERAAQAVRELETAGVPHRHQPRLE